MIRVRLSWDPSPHTPATIRSEKRPLPLLSEIRTIRARHRHETVESWPWHASRPTWRGPGIIGIASHIRTEKGVVGPH
jgi:hypothetical protein